MKQPINEIKRMQQLAGLIKEYYYDFYSSDFKVGDKVRFDPEIMKKKGFKDPIEYYKDLIGTITKVDHYPIEIYIENAQLLYIHLNKLIQPPREFIKLSDKEKKNVDYIVLYQSQSEDDFDMITKI